MNEFTINGRQYSASRLPAFTQFHVARRLAPVIAKFPDMFGLSLRECLSSPGKIQSSLGANIDSIRLDVIAAALADLREEDVNYIFNACLDVARLKDITGWSPVRVNGHIMYSFIGLQELMGIATNVIKANLADFLSASAPTSPPEVGTATA